MPPALGRTRVGHHFTGVGVAAARVQVGVEIMSMPVVLTLSRAACLPYGHGQVSRRKGTWDTTATEKDLEGDSGNHLRGPGPVDRRGGEKQARLLVCVGRIRRRCAAE
ncbi:hypothetical protein DCS_02633 [Drechmeria coniospora]|uniref:Uncharacterized protein n=1 Tax=Drechmeria coniospora TaxID=98403 RepID=A0A151GWP5_DRECN|nr:hypothetical protein DCS_02633 [Drechmeria coniospora]KYK61491.1 hypothetical protein DCS_02633 [Drechmeria coniospora]